MDFNSLSFASHLVLTLYTLGFLPPSPHAQEYTSDTLNKISVNKNIMKWVSNMYRIWTSRVKLTHGVFCGGKGGLPHYLTVLLTHIYSQSKEKLSGSWLVILFFCAASCCWEQYFVKGILIITGAPRVMTSSAYKVLRLWHNPNKS